MCALGTAGGPTAACPPPEAVVTLGCTLPTVSADLLLVTDAVVVDIHSLYRKEKAVEVQPSPDLGTQSREATPEAEQLSSMRSWVPISTVIHR